MNIALLHIQQEALSLLFFLAACYTCSGSIDLFDLKMDFISIGVNTIVGDSSGVEEGWPFLLVLLLHLVLPGAPFNMSFTSDSVKTT